MPVRRPLRPRPAHAAMPPTGMPAPPAPPLPGPHAPLPLDVPVGALIAYAGEVYGQPDVRGAAAYVAPMGWLVCDGQQLRRADWPALFAAIGYRYLQKGEVPNELFRVPDLRGYFLRGVDPTGRVDRDTSARQTPAGEAAAAPWIGSTQSFALQAHEHDYTKPTVASTEPGEGGPVNVITTAVVATDGIVTAKGADAPVTSRHETRPVNVAVYYLIKASNGAFPWMAPLGNPFGR